MFYIENEPDIAAKARQLVLEQFKDLEFYEEEHKYVLHGKELPSVSGIPHRFVRYPFDPQKQAAAYAVKNGETAEYWIRQWECNLTKDKIENTMQSVAVALNENLLKNI